MIYGIQVPSPPIPNLNSNALYHNTVTETFYFWPHNLIVAHGHVVTSFSDISNPSLLMLIIVYADTLQ